MKRRFFSLFLLLVMASMMLLPAFAATSNSTTHYYVDTANQKPLNMRASTSTKSTCITTIPYGAEVGWIGLTDDPAWAAVYYGDYNGYVMVRYLSTRKPDPASEEKARIDKENRHYNYFKAADYYVTVTPSTPTGYVNMRWAPSTDNSVHAKYHQGDVLHVIAETDAWAQVLDETTMTCGFMLKQFLN